MPLREIDGKIAYVNGQGENVDHKNDPDRFVELFFGGGLSLKLLWDNLHEARGCFPRWYPKEAFNADHFIDLWGIDDFVHTEGEKEGYDAEGSLQYDLILAEFNYYSNKAFFLSCRTIKRFVAELKTGEEPLSDDSYSTWTAPDFYAIQSPNLPKRFNKYGKKIDELNGEELGDYVMSGLYTLHRVQDNILAERLRENIRTQNKGYVPLEPFVINRFLATYGEKKFTQGMIAGNEDKNNLNKNLEFNLATAEFVYYSLHDQMKTVQQFVDWLQNPPI